MTNSAIGWVNDILNKVSTLDLRLILTPHPLYKKMKLNWTYKVGEKKI